MTKAAILIGGGFLIKRLPTVRRDVDISDAASIDRAIGQLVWSHLARLQEQYGGEKPYALLYRCFFYDALPYTRRGHFPITKRSIDYSKTPEAVLRLKLFDCLRKRPNFAVRLGQVEREYAWQLKQDAQADLLSGTKQVADLQDTDFAPGFRQKAVDMRLGLDIASLTLKKQVDTVVLVTGDSDFVPAAKLARREGVRLLLDPLWLSVKAELFEHIDGLWSGYPRPGSSRTIEEPLA